MAETAIYDLISYSNNARLRRGYRGDKVLHPRQENLNPIPKLGSLLGNKEIPYEEYDSDSDSENGTYESLMEITLRKTIENANRRAKVARVQKTGHPLFDHLREERALKENLHRKKKPAPKTVKTPVDDSTTTLPPNNSFLHRREGIMQKTATLGSTNRKSLSNSHINNVNQLRSSKVLTTSVSLQQMNGRNGPHRKYSETTVQSLPRKLYQNRDLAKSEQNLFYLRSEIPSYNRYPSNMNQMFEFQARGTGRGFQRKHPIDSSDSDSDNWLIPRPKLAQKKPNKTRNSDDSDFSGPMFHSKR